MPRRLRMNDSGFTLLEVISTCLLLGILVGMAVGPWSSYRHGRAHIEARNELVAALRNAQVSAVAENITYRVDITAKKVVSYRVTASGAEQKRCTRSTTAWCPSLRRCVRDALGDRLIGLLLPRGSASKGDVDVVRSGRPKVYTVSVEGLTARVSYTN